MIMTSSDSLFNTKMIIMLSIRHVEVSNYAAATSNTNIT